MLTGSISEYWSFWNKVNMCQNNESMLLNWHVRMLLKLTKRWHIFTTGRLIGILNIISVSDNVSICMLPLPNAFLNSSSMSYWYIEWMCFGSSKIRFKYLRVSLIGEQDRDIVDFASCLHPSVMSKKQTMMNKLPKLEIMFTVFLTCFISYWVFIYFDLSLIEYVTFILFKYSQPHASILGDKCMHLYTIYIDGLKKSFCQ